MDIGEALVNAYPKMLRFSKSWVRDTAQAEDFAMQACEKILSRPDVNELQNVEAYAITVIKNLIKGLKLMGVNSSEFREIINFKGKTHYGRNPLTTRLFNYKYQANKFRKYSNEDQYTESQNDLIKRISPLRVMINIVPIDQKKILFRKFDLEENFKNDYGNFIAVINTDLISDFFMDKNYEDFNILYKKDNILILRKILN